MIIQCPSCKSLVDVVEAQVTGDEVRLRCSACGQEAVLTRSGSSDAVAVKARTVSEEPSGEEYKEGLEPSRSEATVAVSSMGEDVSRAVEAVFVDDNSKELAAEFLELLPHWEDAERHAKLIQKAAIVGQLPVVGLRYKAVLDVRPDDPRAKAGQDQILTQAMMRMGSMSASTKSPTQDRVKRWTTAAMLLLTVVVCGAIWYMAMMMRSL